MEKVLLEKNELDTIKQIQQTEIDLVDQFGRIEFQVQTLLLQKEELKQEITKLKIASNKLGEQLQQKYGDGNINIETGEFIKTN
jgi:transcription-repair coupling factor (superfamily II helicase)